jgi:hypothetical protein
VNYEGYDGSGWAHQNNDCFTDNYSTGWYIRLLQDSTFRDELRCTYEGYRQTMLDTTTLFAYIDSMGTLVQNAQTRHFQKWPILGMSGPAPDFGPVAETYYGELDSLKSWISTRIQWLDVNIPGLCAPSGLSEISLSNAFYCYPNPSSDHITLDYSLVSPKNVSFHIYSNQGSEVLSIAAGNQNNGKHSLQIDTKSLSPGIYIVHFECDSEILTRKISVMR